MRFFPFQRLRPLLLLAVLLLIATHPLCAQAPTWQDVISVGPGPSIGNRTAVDMAGNTYVLGAFSDTATFGTTTLTGGGIFVAKRSPAGAWLWATRAEGSGSSGDSDTGNGVAVDGSGNVVITGHFVSPTITFGATTLTNAGGRDLFVAKLTPTGAWQWATGVGGNGNDVGTGVAVDGSGNVVVTGYFYSPTLRFGTTTLTNAGDTDLFVGKLTPAGAWQWAKRAGGSGYDYGNGVAVDGRGGVVITGSFESPTIAFGTTTLTNAISSGPGPRASDLFVAKLTPTGAWQWATGAGGSSDDDGAGGVTVDGSGNVLVSGSFRSPSITLGATTLTNAGSYGSFVAKLTLAGAWQWATDAGGGSGIAEDGSGNVVIIGGFSSPTITFGTTTLTNAGGYDIFVAKLTPAGAWLWAIGVGGSDNDFITDAAVDGSGNVVVTGYFTSPTITFGATTLTTSTVALFLARLGTANGLPKDSAAASFTLTPNPARTRVQLTGTPGAPATLLDGLGRVVSTATLSPAGTATLAVGALPAGLYLVRVAGSPAQRLVVE